MYTRRYCLPGLILLLSAVVRVHPQTASQDSNNVVTTIQSKVKVAVVDVVVTKDKDEPVTGLHKEDFEVFEDGKPQTISTFEEHHGVPPTLTKLPPMPPHVYTNFPVTKTADSVNVLLLDALNTPTRDQTFVRQQMIKYLGTIPPGTRVAIFTLASRLRMLQGITTDSSELVAAFHQRRAGPHSSALLPSEVESDSNQQFTDFLIAEQGGGPAPIPFVDPVQIVKEFQADTATFLAESRIRITLQALQQLARYLSEVPGRKNVVWFSGSFPVGIFPDPDLVNSFTAAQNFQQEIEHTAELLTADDVAIYPVGAQGLVTDFVYEANAAETGRKRGSLATQDQVNQLRAGAVSRDSSHAAMEDVARDTGGQAFYDTNGLASALNRVIDIGAHYYTLTYTPTNKTMDGRFRHIELKLANGKYKLAYRRGYYARDLEAEGATQQNPASDPLLPLMGRNLPDFTQILYKELVLPSNPQPSPDAPRIGSNTEIKGPFTRYRVDFAVSSQDIKFDSTPDGERHGSLEIMLVAYDREGKPLNLIAARSELLLQAKDYLAIQRGGLQLRKEIDVPHGDAYLRTGVYDLKSGKAGTLVIPLSAAPAQKADAK